MFPNVHCFVLKHSLRVVMSAVMGGRRAGEDRKVHAVSVSLYTNCGRKRKVPLFRMQSFPVKTVNMLRHNQIPQDLANRGLLHSCVRLVGIYIPAVWRLGSCHRNKSFSEIASSQCFQRCASVPRTSNATKILAKPGSSRAQHPSVGTK